MQYDKFGNANIWKDLRLELKEIVRSAFLDAILVNTGS